MAERRRHLAAPELWILSALSALLHFWRLLSPRAVVFDELYYERFAGYSLNGTHFFDVHPPLGRLLFTAVARLLHADPAALIAPEPFPAMRILPAFAGTLLVPLVFILLRQLGASRRAASLGAIAILLDNALLAMSRIILPDILLIAFGVGAISAFLAARDALGARRTGWIILAAALAGCALSVKWTGASGLGVVLAAWLFDAVRRRQGVRRFVAEGLLLVAIPAAIYLGAWWIHFRLATHSGPGDAYMSVRFQQSMPGSPHYDPAAPPLGFWRKLGEVHHAIRYGNGALQNVTHPAASAWYTWPTMKTPIPFWAASPSADGSRSMIILLGNPAVWWGALIAAVIGILLFLGARKRFAEREYGFVLLLGAFLLNFLPFIAIKRVMYLYHYLFALTLLAALGAYVVGAIEGAPDADTPPWRFGTRRSAISYAAIVALLIAGFVYFAPFTFALPLGVPAWDARFWVLHPTF